MFQPAAKDAVKSDAKTEAMVTTVLRQLMKGTLDRSLLNDNLNFYFTDMVLADYRSSLAGLGDVKSLEVLRSTERGGMDGYFYRMTGSVGQPITVFVYVTKDGKLDQLLLRR